MPYDAYGQWYDGPPELPVLGGPIPPLQANYESATGSLPPGRMTPPMMAPYSTAPGQFAPPPGTAPMWITSDSQEDMDPFLKAYRLSSTPQSQEPPAAPFDFDPEEEKQYMRRWEITAPPPALRPQATGLDARGVSTKEYALDAYRASMDATPVNLRPLHTVREASMSAADVLRASYPDLGSAIENAIKARKTYPHVKGSLFPELSFDRENIYRRHPVQFKRGQPPSKRFSGGEIQSPGTSEYSWVRGFAPGDVKKPRLVGLSGRVERPFTSGEAQTLAHELRHTALEQDRPAQSMVGTRKPSYVSGIAESGLGKMSAEFEGKGETGKGGRDAAWEFSPLEMDVRLGGIKALYKRATGIEITNEEQGMNAWNWYKELIQDPEAAKLYSGDWSLLTPEEIIMWEQMPNWNEPKSKGQLPFSRQFWQRLPKLLKNEPSKLDSWQQPQMSPFGEATIA